MRSRLPLRRAVAAVVLSVALIGLLLLVRLGREGGAPAPEGLPEGWVVLSGGVDRLGPAEGPGGGSLLAREEAALRIGEVHLLVAARSILALPPAGGEGADGLPRLLHGTMVVTAPAPLRIEGSEVVPSPGARLEVSRDALVVLDGEIEVLGERYGPGATLGFRAGGGLLARPQHVLPGAGTVSKEAVRPAGDEPATGQVVDAQSGSPLPGTLIRAVFCHADDGDPSLLEAGTVAGATADARGFFRIEPFRPEDPRVKLHLEADHPDFLPLVHVSEEEPEPSGRRPFVTLRLRRALTSRVLFLDGEGAAVGGLALEAEEIARDRFVGEDAWEEGRSVRSRRPTVRYTAPDGSLRLPRAQVRLAIRHPLLHFWGLSALDPHLRGAEAPAAFWPLSELFLDLGPRSPARPSPDPVASIAVQPSQWKEYRLQDSAGRPAAGAEVEIALEGEPVVRLFTDESGAFAFAPRPHPQSESTPPLSPEHPRRGTLTVLSPRLWKRQVPVAFPSRAGDIAVGGHPGGQLVLRLFEDAGEGRAGPPIAARGLRLSEELTLVRRTAGGEALLEGPLPRPGRMLLLAAAGYTPVEVRIPPHPPGESLIDLGTILLDRGRTLLVRIAGAGPSELERARLLIAPRDRPALGQEHRFGRTGAVHAGGLTEGLAYRYAIEGSGLEPAAGELLATAELLREGLTVPISTATEVDTLLEGEVAGIRPEETPLFRVIERYYSGGEGDPLTFRSYPLPPDGRLGSRRLLPPVLRAEVFVVGPGRQAAHAVRDRAADGSSFSMGRLFLRECTRAVFSFRVEGLGKVGPPHGVELVAAENRNHEVARLWIEDGVLEVENLLPGAYTLRWGGEGEPVEVHEFRVKPGAMPLGGEVLRQARAREEVELRIADRDGNPIAGAEIRPEEPDPGARTEEVRSSPGRYRVEIGTREENRFLIERQEFLPARLILPPGALLPDPLVLVRGARARALVLEPGGRRWSGALEVSFPPGAGPEVAPEAGAAPEAKVIQGAPFTATVEAGVFQGDLFPPGRTRVVLRDLASEARAERLLDLPATTITDLGRIVLEETRSLEGVVLLPAGDPAAEAVVSLVKPAKALRFPLREAGPRAAAYSAKADGLGRFRIDGLPLDLGEELALVAHLPGYTDAVESPLELGARGRRLVLAPGASLLLDAGYADGSEARDFEFRLQYSPYAGARGEAGETTDLGPLPLTLRGGALFEGISPGVYRLLWNLREPHPAVLPRIALAAVTPGTRAVLSLRIEERIVPGEAFFNRAPLESGWILLYTQPDRPAEASIGRVRGGRFEAPVSPRADGAHAALIPERDPLPFPNFTRGEALPQKVRDFRSQVRRKFLSFHYRAHELTLELPADALARHPGLEIEFPHYAWSQAGWRATPAVEPVSSIPFRLSLVAPGSFAFRLAARGGPRLLHTVAVEEDLTVRLSF